MEAVAGASVLVERMDLKPGMRVLDVGCGPGRLTIPLAKHVGPTARVTAFDIQERMLQALARLVGRLDNIEIVRGRAGEGDMKRRTSLIVPSGHGAGEIPKKDKALRNLPSPQSGRNRP